jgi:hypothetical protein
MAGEGPALEETLGAFLKLNWPLDFSGQELLRYPVTSIYIVHRDAL